MNILLTGLLVLVGSFAFGVLRKLITNKLRQVASNLPKPYLTTVHVIDGDTVVDKEGRRIRLHAIDAPELSQRQGAASRKFLWHLLNEQTVHVRPVHRDKYDRIVAELSLPEHGVMVNAAVVESGYALADSRFGNAYVRQEKRARRSRAGLWKAGTIECPSQFRRFNASRM